MPTPHGIYVKNHFLLEEWDGAVRLKELWEQEPWGRCYYVVDEDIVFDEWCYLIVAKKVNTPQLTTYTPICNRCRLEVPLTEWKQHYDYDCEWDGLTPEQRMHNRWVEFGEVQT